MKLLASRITNLGSENAFKVGEDIKRAEQNGTKVIRFNLGEPDFNSPDFVNQVAIEQIRRGNSHYCAPAGLENFRKAIARHISQTRNLRVEPDQVVVTPGAKPPIGYSLLTYVNPGDEVIYPSPGFPIYESWTAFVGAKLVPLHLDEAKGFSFTAADLEKLLTPRTKLLFINSPSNPTGGVLSEADLQDIAVVIRQQAGPELRIYSDEVYEDILFDGLQHHSIASQPGMQERTILVSGHSKSFAMTGWRLGYAVLPTVAEAEVFKNLNINLVSCTPPFIQEAGREAYESPLAQQSIERMRNEFQKRRDYVVKNLNNIGGIRCAMPRGAFYAFPNIAGVCQEIGAIEAFERLPKDKQALSSPSTLFQKFLLYRYGVATMDRRSFGKVGSEGKHYLRLSTATSLENLQAGLALLAKAAEDRTGFAAFIQENRFVF